MDLSCTKVWEDNAGAIHLAKNPARTDNSKNIDARHHFLREPVDNAEVTHVASVDQHADFLTKPLHLEAFETHRDFVMNIG